MSVLQYMRDGRMKTIMENLLNDALQDGVEKKSLTATSVILEPKDEIVCFDFIKTKVHNSYPDECEYFFINHDCTVVQQL